MTWRFRPGAATRHAQLLGIFLGLEEVIQPVSEFQESLQQPDRDDPSNSRNLFSNQIAMTRHRNDQRNGKADLTADDGVRLCLREIH